MKKLPAISAVALAVLTAGAAATPSFAADSRGYGNGDVCQSRQHDNGTTGAVVGGVGGALLGSSLAGRHDGRAGGAVIGGLVGALLGNSIGRSSARSSDACEGRDYGRVAYRQTTPYNGGGYDRGYGERQYRGDGYRTGERDYGHRYDAYGY